MVTSSNCLDGSGYSGTIGTANSGLATQSEQYHVGCTCLLSQLLQTLPGELNAQVWNKKHISVTVECSWLPALPLAEQNLLRVLAWHDARGACAHLTQVARYERKASRTKPTQKRLLFPVGPAGRYLCVLQAWSSLCDAFNNILSQPASWPLLLPNLP